MFSYGNSGQRTTQSTYSETLSSRPFTGAAGLIVSVNRILTKDLVADMRFSIVYFFCLSTAIVAACVIAHRIVERSEFVQYHLSACARSIIAFDNDGGPGGGGGAVEEVRIILALIGRLTCTCHAHFPALLLRIRHCRRSGTRRKRCLPTTIRAVLSSSGEAKSGLRNGLLYPGSHMRFLELLEKLSGEEHDRRIANLAAHVHHRPRLLRHLVPVPRHRVRDHELQPWLLDARPSHGDFQLLRPRR